MSTRITYSKELTSTLETLDGTITFDNELMFPPNTRARYVELMSVFFTRHIPNLYILPVSATNPVEYNNSCIQFSISAGAVWHTLQFDQGLYTVSDIQDAINATIAADHYWLDNNDPGFAMSYNIATQRVFVTIDNTKLAAVNYELWINFIYSPTTNGNLGELLGFTSIINHDGLTEADELPAMDVYGQTISMNLDGLGPLTTVNGIRSTEICNIPIAGTVLGDTHVFPFAALKTKQILLSQCPDRIPSLSFKFFSSRTWPEDGTKKSIFGVDGSVIVTLDISYV